VLDAEDHRRVEGRIAVPVEADAPRAGAPNSLPIFLPAGWSLAGGNSGTLTYRPSAAPPVALDETLEVAEAVGADDRRLRQRLPKAREELAAVGAGIAAEEDGVRAVPRTCSTSSAATEVSRRRGA
jgi:hypothetical protein